MLATLIAAALVPGVIVQPQANALSVFCVGASWDNGNGGTMAGSGYPSPVSTTLRDDFWHAGSAGDTRAIKYNLWRGTHRVYYPDNDKKRECPPTAAAPCVDTDTVTITAETWSMQHWEVHITAGGAYAGGLVAASVTGGYGREWGKRDSTAYTLSDLVPVPIGTTYIPSNFIDWRIRPGVIRGAYFKTGATCRDGEQFGQQYEYRDENWANWTAEENNGAGVTWIQEGTPFDKWI